MKFLIIGQGGREHAIIRSLHNSPSVQEIHAIPGSDGFKKMALCHQLNWKNPSEIIEFCQRTQIDVVIIGPEDPLVFGLADHLRNRGLLVFGPNQEAAQLEGSKIFAKNFMIEANIPTAKYQIIKSYNEALLATKNFPTPYVLKADGLCAGKGVFICQTQEELQQAAHKIFIEKTFGEAGHQALFEEPLLGWEMSLLVLTNGSDYKILPVAMDHKRLSDQNHGPNTGGMGTIAPMPISKDLMDEIEATIILPSIKTLNQKKYLYRGVLFIGLMITKHGPKVLEYNVRFGDPETQVLLPLLDVDFGDFFKSLAEGRLPPMPQKPLACCCVVLAAEGYPEHPKKGVPIDGPLFIETPLSYFLHAGTQLKNDQWQTSGGRVINAIGLGETPTQARESAYTQAKKIHWPGVQMRSDIGNYLPTPT